MQPLFDVPITDVMTAQIAGGEFIIVALVYALAFRDPVRFRALLWLCALDQLFAVVLPALAVAHGAIPGTWKIVAPIPFSAALVLLFIVYALRPPRRTHIPHEWEISERTRHAAFILTYSSKH